MGNSRLHSNWVRAGKLFRIAQVVDVDDRNQPRLMINSEQTMQMPICENPNIPRKLSVPLADKRKGSMWLSVKNLRDRPSRAQLESLLVQNTAALKKLSRQLLKAQDEERRRVARDLHDHTGQTLAALKMAAVSLENKLQHDEDTAGVLCDIAALADQALKEIRTTSYLLHPPLLDEVGFTAAAQWYVQGFGERSGINVTLDFATPPERLSTEIEIALFRVLQESLTNVHRHAQSPSVAVCFLYHPEAVILEITDCGRGIPAEMLQGLGEGTAEVGVGLAGMRERLDELNGALSINSNESGTTLRAIVPLTPAADISPLCRDYGSFPPPPIPHFEERSASL
jgi:signal transduction histidine kinase